MVSEIKKNGTKFIDHNTAINGTKGNLKARRDTKRINKVLFVKETPNENVKIIKPRTK